MLAPIGTPKPIIAKLSTEINNALKLPDMKEKLDSLGMEPYILTPDQFGAFMKAEFTKFAEVVKTANIRLEN